MQPWLRLPCSRCGAGTIFRVRHAGRWRRCGWCKAPVRVPPIGKPVNSAPPPTRHSRDSCWRIWALGAVAALVLVPVTWWVLHERERARTADHANQVVIAKVEEAQAHVSRQRWDEAATLLEAALAMDRATKLDEARTLLDRVRRERANALLAAADSALARRRPAEAADLLRRYLADSHATECGRAAKLQEELEFATSDTRALAHLRGLSYAALVDLAQKGTPPELDGITHPDVRAMYGEKLRSFLLDEFQRRERDHARRLQNIRASPAFGELRDFVGLTRHRLATRGGGEINYRLLGRLFRELNVNGAVEQRRVLGKLGRQPLDYEEAEKITRVRADLKGRFRAYAEFDATDREIFNWIVDRETDRLLQELQGSPAASES